MFSAIGVTASMAGAGGKFSNCESSLGSIGRGPWKIEQAERLTMIAPTVASLTDLASFKMCSLVSKMNNDFFHGFNVFVVIHESQ